METSTLTYSIMPGTPFPIRQKFTTSRTGRVLGPSSMRLFGHTLIGNLHMAITTSPICLNVPPVAQYEQTPRLYLSTKLKTYHLFSGLSSRSSSDVLTKCISLGTTIRRFIHGPVRMYTVWQDLHKSIRVIAVCSRTRIDFLLQSTHDLKTSSVESHSAWIRSLVPKQMWDWSEYTDRSTRWKSPTGKIYYYWDGRIQSSAKLNNHLSNSASHTLESRVAPGFIKIVMPPVSGRSASLAEANESRTGSETQYSPFPALRLAGFLKRATSPLLVAPRSTLLSKSPAESWISTPTPISILSLLFDSLRSMRQKVMKRIESFFSPT